MYGIMHSSRKKKRFPWISMLIIAICTVAGILWIEQPEDKRESPKPLKTGVLPESRRPLPEVTPSPVEIQEIKEVALPPWSEVMKGYGLAHHTVRPMVRELWKKIYGREGAERQKALYENLPGLPASLSGEEITVLLGEEREESRFMLLELVLTKTNHRSVEASSVPGILKGESYGSRSKLIAALAPYIKTPMTIEETAAVLGEAKGEDRLNCLRPVAALIGRPLYENDIAAIVRGFSLTEQEEAKKLLFGANDLSEKFVKARPDL